jgi:hypothetical protein
MGRASRNRSGKLWSLCRRIASASLRTDLTILATSDVHGLIEWDYSNKGLQRPVTLVFAKERSLAAIS